MKKRIDRIGELLVKGAYLYNEEMRKKKENEKNALKCDKTR